MPFLYAISSMGARLYLCLEGHRVAYTPLRTRAADIRIETPFSSEPLTLAEASTRPRVVFRFPEHPETPMYPAAGGIVEESALSVAEKPTTSADALYRNWTVTYNADNHSYRITQSIAPAYGIGITGADPILTSWRLCSFREEPAEPEYEPCESCSTPVAAGNRWCSFGCRCDADATFGREYRVW